MTEAEAKTLILDALAGIAPEADLRSLAGDADLRETLDLDSMDFLTFVTALHERARVEIREQDYPAFMTLDGAAAFLAKGC